jgi:hypothetical protein
MMGAKGITRGRAVREGCLGVARRFEQCRSGQCPFLIGRDRWEETIGLDCQGQRWWVWLSALQSSCRMRGAERQ